MFDLGRMQELKIQRINDSGALLVDPAAPLITLLLPGKQIPEGAGPGSMIKVFIYRDSEDRLIATTKQPALTLGELAILPVISVSQIGAFLDWGLEKDLFLPFKEQRGRVKPGMKVLVALYIDKSSRLCATMNVYDYLSAESPYQQGDRVRGTVYGIQPEIGAFVAVDNRYFGLIPRQELHQRLSLGEEVEGRVIRLRPDGKLNISLQKKAYAQMKPDAEKVLGVIEEYGGVLPFTDKASPEVIEREMQMSKAAFKRAVGHLLKEKKIEITATAIRKL
ncbi:MAG: S1 RNA-binding domain-containing protein [Lachnospiraceae bacterium]|nr:S1 RNA-binding domain-containing protein [Lachnospiraceae bacterium]